MPTYKKFILSTLIALILISSSLFSAFVSNTQAQAPGPWYDTEWGEFYNKVYNTDVSPPSEIFGERYTAAQVQWIFYSIPAIFLNTFVGSDTITCILNNDLGDCVSTLFSYATPNEKYDPNASVLATLFPKDRSLSGVSYLRSRVARFSITPEAQAQGFGFQALDPVSDLWREFRNIAYGFMIVVVLVMAFMIMFRVKLTPQTVVTVQSALPKVIITIILITFSYAIAGLMIDLMYVVIGLIAFVFTQTEMVLGVTDWDRMFNFMTNGPIMHDTFGGGILAWMLVYLLIFVLSYFAALLGTFGVFSGIAIIVPPIAIAAMGFAIILLIAGFLVLLWAALKTILLMIKTYVKILLLVIFSPFYIGIGALVPGAGFGSWLRSLLANLAVYPVVGTLVMLAFLFLTASSAPAVELVNNITGSDADILEVLTADSGFWYPPLTFGLQIDQINPLPILWLITSLVIVLQISKAGDLIKSLIEGRPFAGTAMGEAMGPIGFVAGLGASRYEQSQRKAISKSKEAAEVAKYDPAAGPAAAVPHIQETARLERQQDRMSGILRRFRR